jgi:hypothetical protein
VLRGRSRPQLDVRVRVRGATYQSAAFTQHWRVPLTR